MYLNYSYTEYIQTQLISKLQKDSLYYCVFYVSRANDCQYSMETLGAYFSSNKINYPDLLYNIRKQFIDFQFKNPNGFLVDTMNWIKVSGIFKADGGEEYMTIGSYDVSKDLVKEENPNTYNWFAYYGIDDIAVYPISAPVETAKCGTDKSICKGEAVQLGASNVQTEYLPEYSFEWRAIGEDSIFSTEEHPIVYPTKTTTYILHLTDFKFDKSIDSVTVFVEDCENPQLKVYPNPTTEIVHFECSYPFPEITHIEIFDACGRLVQKESIYTNGESQKITLELKDFVPGVYFYSIVFSKELEYNGKIVFLGR